MEVNLEGGLFELIKKEEYEKLRRERLNYAFDSLYFRYAEAVDEIALLKSKLGKSEPSAITSGKKMHFYTILEETLEAHSEKNKIERG